MREKVSARYLSSPLVAHVDMTGITLAVHDAHMRAAPSQQSTRATGGTINRETPKP
ncbi:hypothetical protein [Corynebacterium efficiens YS-314]|uniref:Uncharacterized protein n=1 Tax=Corynebacterium efficiens (strain DSM 44549 / YS-314 / AJ 12310 / JCM 11189 / NBRC 100395) TaxID=196164 RepID=Q8FME1_COREF|nr:hypothetical protein [Corynebacterium efficiens YS-314]